MEQIINMEYSLSAILYLVDMQISLNVPASNLWNKETETFCNLTEYKQEVLEYLVKYNNDNLSKTLKNQLSICDAIVTKWEKFIGGNSEDFNWHSYMGIDWIDDDTESNRYNVYFLFANEHHLFDKITLLKRGYDKKIKKEYIETAKGNVTDRDWDWDRTYKLDYFDELSFPNATDMKILVRFAKDVKNFLKIYFNKSNSIGF